MWLIMAGLICAGFTMLWAFAAFIRAENRARHIVYLLLILAAFILGFINELIHAKDAWASMPDALIVSGIAAVVVVVATGLGLSSWPRAGALR